MSDGMQSLFPDQFDTLVNEARQIAAVVGKTVAAPVSLEAIAATR
jgi:hypothetical protein